MTQKAYAAVRKTEGKEWIDMTTIDIDSSKIKQKAELADQQMGPILATKNPVQRIVPVEVCEMKTPASQSTQTPKERKDMSQENDTAFVLNDAGTHPENETQSVKVLTERDGLALILEPKGYGTKEDPDAGPVLLEKYNGCLRLVVWADKNFANPTHIINLEDAKVD